MLLNSLFLFVFLTFARRETAALFTCTIFLNSDSLGACIKNKTIIFAKWRSVRHRMICLSQLPLRACGLFILMSLNVVDCHKEIQKK